ncbi:phospholipase D family protein [Niallia sp. NCCP-28]|uniref:phospholipase D family protein n=1 Tax=Niallia sp. NCCP-28 TaxID=2934712 RepID=UPI0020873D51|nr:phospholipase D family protein [Niallia sp. NCCP-28]GKU82808.1 phospholipase D [Niallia sp. NCCP-28]
MKQTKTKRKKIWFAGMIVFISIYISVIFYHNLKPLPLGLSMEGEVYYSNHVTFLKDITYKDNSGKQTSKQEILTSILKQIEEADAFIVIDMFLFNKDSDKDQAYPKMAETVAQALIKKKQAYPAISIIFITDRVNTAYSSYPSKELTKMKENGIEVIMTNLHVLRDSNPLYSGIWRMFFQWFGEKGNGQLPNLLANSAPKVNLWSYLDLLNVKANHRKVVITEKAALISSGNIHNASGYHSNTAFLIEGNIVADALKSENSVIKFSKDIDFPIYKEKEGVYSDLRVQLLTEGKIAKHVLSSIKAAKKDDIIWIGMLYLADRKIVDALKQAASSDVMIHIILDPNQNSFGNKKAGLPNIPVAAELANADYANLQIKWYNTGKEQYHTKMMFIEGKQEDTIISGSANYTRRNLQDLNLETNVKISGPKEATVMKDVKSYFEALWNNQGAEYTKDYHTEDTVPVFRYMLYRLQRLFWFTTY